MVIPALVAPGHPDFGSVSEADLRAAGRLETAAWLAEVEKHWKRARKSGEKAALFERIDTYGQLSAQSTMQRFVILSNASGGSPAACVLDTTQLHRPFVTRDKTYWCSTDSEPEAHYVTAMLNSAYAFSRIRPFMTRGLMGPRDIHKRVLDVPWPRFDASSSTHLELAQVSQSLAKESAQILAGSDSAHLSRNDLKSRLSPALLERVEEIVGQVSSAV